MVDRSLIVIVGNTLVVFATFFATLYRIKIERDQIRTFKGNVSALFNVWSLSANTLKLCVMSLWKWTKLNWKSLWITMKN